MTKIFDPRQVNLYQPSPSSHKGQNGKLLVIGGSKLFHSSIFWAADVASKIVDLVHLTSPANENNQIFRNRLKQKFWNGIVVDWGDVESYIEEDDCVLIGPGMVRDSEFSEHSENSERRISSENQTAGESENPTLRFSESLTFRPSESSEFSELLKTAGEDDRTSVIVNSLLGKYPSKRWVIDGGGLQQVDPELITQSCILTPHRKEFERLTEKVNFSENSENSDNRISSENQKSRKSENPVLRFSDIPKFRSPEFSECSELSKKLKGATILLKGPTDVICQGSHCTRISGGNPGMTKGGTGDVLAGLVAALYCKNDCWTTATVGSWVNKTAGDELYKKVGPYFNAADLVAEVPKVLAKFAKPVASREV